MELTDTLRLDAGAILELAAQTTFFVILSILFYRSRQDRPLTFIASWLMLPPALGLTSLVLTFRMDGHGSVMTMTGYLMAAMLIQQLATRIDKQANSVRNSIPNPAP